MLAELHNPSWQTTIQQVPEHRHMDRISSLTGRELTTNPSREVNQTFGRKSEKKKIKEVGFGDQVVEDGQVNVIIAILQIELKKGRFSKKKDTITFVFPLILCLNKKIHDTDMKLSHNQSGKLRGSEMAH